MTTLASLKSMDDAEVARLYTRATDSEGREILREELEGRKRFENAWSGEWKSGPDAPVPKRHADRAPSISREEIRRAEFRKLCAQAKSGPKAQRDAAKHLLKTCYGKSVS